MRKALSDPTYPAYSYERVSIISPRLKGGQHPPIELMILIPKIIAITAVKIVIPNVVKSISWPEPKSK